MLNIVIIKKKNLITVLAILLILGIIAIINIPKKIQRIIYKKEYCEFVEKYSNEYGVDENLIYAVIKAESNFKIEAKSDKSAIGLMQLMESTAKDVIKKVNIKIADEELQTKLHEPDLNINLGVKYLSILIEKYENVSLAVAAYNAGIGTVDNWIEKGIIKSDGSDIENIPYKETNNYVRKVLRHWKQFEKIDI